MFQTLRLFESNEMGPPGSPFTPKGSLRLLSPSSRRANDLGAGTSEEDFLVHCSPKLEDVFLESGDEAGVEDTDEAAASPSAADGTTTATNRVKLFQILPNSNFPNQAALKEEAALGFGPLFLGPIAFTMVADSAEFLRSHNISAVLSVVSEVGEDLTAAVRKCGVKEEHHHVLALEDHNVVGGKKAHSLSAEEHSPLSLAVEFVHSQRREGRGVLVHCDMGVTRSPSVIAAYLIMTYNLDFAAVVQFMKIAAPHANIRLFANSLRSIALNARLAADNFTTSGEIGPGLVSPNSNFYSPSMSPSQLSNVLSTSLRSPSGGLPLFLSRRGLSGQFHAPIRSPQAPGLHQFQLVLGSSSLHDNPLAGGPLDDSLVSEGAKEQLNTPLGYVLPNALNSPYGQHLRRLTAIGDSSYSWTSVACGGGNIVEGSNAASPKAQLELQLPSKLREKELAQPRGYSATTSLLNPPRSAHTPPPQTDTSATGALCPSEQTE